MSLQILVNGEPKGVPEESTVADLVASMGLRPEQVAVEVNRSLVARELRTATSLSEGDRIELVTLVGGG